MLDAERANCRHCSPSSALAGGPTAPCGRSRTPHTLWLVVAGVLALFDGSRGAEKALERATVISRESGAPLSVLVLAFVEKPSHCCNMQTTFWNREMRRIAGEDAQRARSLLADEHEAQVIIREGSRDDVVREVAAELGCRTIVEARSRGRTRRRDLPDCPVPAR